MDYYESAEDERCSYRRAMRLCDTHGVVWDHEAEADFAAVVEPTKDADGLYCAQAVLSWLGY